MPNFQDWAEKSMPSWVSNPLGVDIFPLASSNVHHLPLNAGKLRSGWVRRVRAAWAQESFSGGQSQKMQYQTKPEKKRYKQGTKPPFPFFKIKAVKQYGLCMWLEC